MKKARSNPHLLSALVMKRQPSMQFSENKFNLTNGHWVAGFAEYKGQMYLKLGKGLEDDEVLSIAPNLISKLMGLDNRGPKPQRGAPTDKRFVQDYMVVKLNGYSKDQLITGDGAIVEAFKSDDPRAPGLREYIQRRRKELWLGDRPRISVFHARALISEIIDKATFDWAGLKVLSLKKVISDWAVKEDKGSTTLTTNQQFVCEYVALALSLKAKWEGEKPRDASDERGNMNINLPLELTSGKKRKLSSRVSDGGPENDAHDRRRTAHERTRTNKDERPAERLTSSNLSSLREKSRNQVGDLEERSRELGQSSLAIVQHNNASPSGTVTVEKARKTTGARAQSPNHRSKQPRRSEGNSESDFRDNESDESQPVTAGPEVPHEDAGGGTSGDQQVALDVDRRRAKLLAEIDGMKKLRDFTLQHCANRIEELNLELKSLGREETRLGRQQLVWDVDYHADS